jgi:hypothetical protein
MSNGERRGPSRRSQTPVASVPDGGTTYIIREQGQLGASPAPALAELEVSVASADADYPVVVLIGRLVDQDALFDALDALCQLGLSLLSVETVRGTAHDASR